VNYRNVTIGSKPHPLSVVSVFLGGLIAPANQGRDYETQEQYPRFPGHASILTKTLPLIWLPATRPMLQPMLQLAPQPSPYTPPTAATATGAAAVAAEAIAAAAAVAAACSSSAARAQYCLCPKPTEPPAGQSAQAARQPTVQPCAAEAAAYRASTA
jgi:hypothetical protein